MGVFCFEEEVCSGTRQALGTEMGCDFLMTTPGGDALFSRARGSFYSPGRPFSVEHGRKVLLFSVLFF